MNETLPDIYHFNPTCEYAVANSRPSWQPNLLLQKMEEDLELLPLFLCRPNDVVLVKNLPPAGYHELLEQTGIHTPRFRRVTEIISDKSFLHSPKNRLLPWGWSPAAHRLLDPLKPSCSPEFRASPVAKWQPEYREIYSKKFALGILTSILKAMPQKIMLSPQFIPEICTTQKELEELLARWGKLMVKAPWSSSGRGLQRITKTPVVPKVWEKLNGIMRDQGYAIVEPYLDKVLDMALQFRITRGKIEYVGMSRFFTDEKGQYQGNYLNGWPGSVEPRAAGFAENVARILVPAFVDVLQKSLLAVYYEGNFGTDTLIFSDEKGDLRMNPCLEINVRQNMGQLSLHLEKLLTPGAKAVFKIFYEKGKTFGAFQKTMQAKYPLQIKDKRIDSGFFPLTPANESTLFGAYILAGV